MAAFVFIVFLFGIYLNYFDGTKWGNESNATGFHRAVLVPQAFINCKSIRGVKDCFVLQQSIVSNEVEKNADNVIFKKKNDSSGMTMEIEGGMIFDFVGDGESANRIIMHAKQSNGLQVGLLTVEKEKTFLQCFLFDLFVFCAITNRGVGMLHDQKILTFIPRENEKNNASVRWINHRERLQNQTIAIVNDLLVVTVDDKGRALNDKKFLQIDRLAHGETVSFTMFLKNNFTYYTILKPMRDLVRRSKNNNNNNNNTVAAALSRSSLSTVFLDGKIWKTIKREDQQQQNGQHVPLVPFLRKGVADTNNDLKFLSKDKIYHNIEVILKGKIYKFVLSEAEMYVFKKNHLEENILPIKF